MQVQLTRLRVQMVRSVRARLSRLEGHMGVLLLLQVCVC